VRSLQSFRNLRRFGHHDHHVGSRERNLRGGPLDFRIGRVRVSGWIHALHVSVSSLDRQGPQRSPLISPYPTGQMVATRTWAGNGAVGDYSSFVVDRWCVTGRNTAKSDKGKLHVGATRLPGQSDHGDLKGSGVDISMAS
jgi:hypothetical protein